MTSNKEIDWKVQPLGKVTDTALAKQLGVTTATVTHTRRRLGIPGLRVVKDAERLAGPSRGEINWNEQPLGELPDLELARILGTHRARVRLARIRRGIPLFVEKDTTFGHKSADRELERLREARWYRYPLTAEPCRFCTEARHMRALKGRSNFMIRLTDQGPACARHYLALPRCSQCEAPAICDDGLCEDCITRVIRNEREQAGWRREVFNALPSVDRGDVETVRRGIRAFEAKQEKRIGGAN